ncbi:c-type cytochrome [Bacteroidota bacterium]
MTNAQKWVAVVLGLFLVLFLISRFTKNDDQADTNFDSYNEQESSSNTKTDGLDLVTKIGCISCHGDDLKGTELGPSLFLVNEYWSRGKLINYLRNPSSFSGDERFEEYKKTYRALMPSYNNIDVKQLGIIAEFILGLSEE